MYNHVVYLNYLLKLNEEKNKLAKNTCGSHFVAAYEITRFYFPNRNYRKKIFRAYSGFCIQWEEKFNYGPDVGPLFNSQMRNSPRTGLFYILIRFVQRDDAIC